MGQVFTETVTRRFPLGYTNTLSDGAQFATSLLAKSSRQRPLFLTICFWMKFRAPKLDSVLALTSSLKSRITNTNTFEKDEMLYLFSTTAVAAVVTTLHEAKHRYTTTISPTSALPYCLS